MESRVERGLKGAPEYGERRAGYERAFTERRSMKELENAAAD